MALLDIFGETPSYYGGLLGDEELRKAKDYAQSQGLQNAAMALLQAGAPSRTPSGGALAIAQGLQMGQQAYKQAMNESLKDRLTQFQVQDMMQKRLEDQAMRQQQAQAQRILQSAYRPEQGMIGETPWNVLRDEEGNLMPDASVRPAGLDLQSVLPALRALGPGGMKALSEQLAVEKSLRPEYKEVGGQLFEIPALGGKPTSVAGSKKRDTVTVGNVVLDKDTMQVLYTAPDATAGSVKEFQDFQKLSPDEQKAYLKLQEGKRPSTTINMPTGEERKAAVLANRLNFGVAQMNQAIGQDPTASMPNTTAEAAKFFTRSDFLANKLTPEKRQIVESAQLDILDAALTLGTGAAYTREQLDGYRKSYFPQLGDTEANVKTKQQRLENLLKSAEIASGRAASNIPTKIPQSFEMPTEQSTVIPSGVIVRKR